MINFIRKLFGSRHQPYVANKMLIDEMSFDDIIAFMENKRDSIHNKELVNCLKRLFEIALWDNHVPDQQREMALKLTDAIMQDLEKGLPTRKDGYVTKPAVIY